MLLVATILIVFATAAYGQPRLVIRENGKLCSQWISLAGAEVSIPYTPSKECAGALGVEYTNTYSHVRVCCPVLPATTASSIFPRECGKQQYQPIKGRIVGGMHAQPNSWPWQVRLYADGGLCGGTLIDTRHVLTAAHCLQKPIIPQNYRIYIGLHDINQPVYDEQEMVAEKIFMHEGYNELTSENDIAVIRLPKPVTISDKVNVICLPGAEANRANETVWVAGWGTTSFQGQTSAVLKQASLTIMPDRCGVIYRTYNNQKQMCAGAYGGGHDTCQGDSGGPLMYESNGQWFLNGVVSYGHECARDGFPGVYARVSYYLPWVRSKLVAP